MKSHSEYIKLICKRVRFYSTLDKHSFFTSLNEIKPIIDITGEKDAIILSIDSKHITDDDVANLTALFRRYFICLEQLEALGVDDDGLPRYHDYEIFSSYCVYPCKAE